MINQQTLQGNWTQLTGKLRTKWGQLTDDELQQARGSVDQLIGLIHSKTGEGREAIEEFLDNATATGASAVSQTADKVRKFSHDASEAVQDTTRKAADSVREGYQQAESMIRSKPAESLALCFGAGVLVGVCAALMLRPRD